MLNVERLLPNITPKIILLSAFMCICLWFVFVDYNIVGMKSFSLGITNPYIPIFPSYIPGVIEIR